MNAAKKLFTLTKTTKLLYIELDYFLLLVCNEALIEF